MKGIAIVSLVLVFAGTALAGVNADRLKSHCLAPTETEALVYAESFPFNAKTNYSILEDRFEKLYETGSRLLGRAYFDEASGSIKIPVTGSTAEVAPLFIESLAAQLTRALDLKYADFPFFSDMGHVHYHIPQKKFDEEYDPIPTNERGRLYTQLMADPEVKILYHTAEQLTMTNEESELLQDRHLQWRYWTRNIIGPNDGSGDLIVVRNPDLERFNTVGSHPGHQSYSAGVYIHATKNGCFSFEQEGRTYFFDISYTYFPYANLD